MSDRLVYGWGIKDVEYKVIICKELPSVNGKRRQECVWTCPYYRDWKGMIQRCFDSKYQESCPTYKGCTITENWKYLSNFIKWVDSQPNRDWIRCSPDKDLLFEGNKLYSPETVVYIPQSLNLFIIDKAKSRGKYMLGVSFCKRSRYNPYKSQCNNPFTRKYEYLGLFATELEAHKAWQAKKHEYACQLADLQDDPIIAAALRQRYAPDKDWTNR